MHLDNYNFSPKLADIFGPVEKHAAVTINYKAFPCEIDDEYVVDFRVQSVNGCNSLKKFHELSSDILTLLLEEVGKAMRNIPKRSRSKVSEEITDQFTDVMDMVSYERVNVNDDYHSFCDEVNPREGCYLFTMANFSGDDYHNSGAYIDQILYAASDYAYILWEVMTNALDKLRMLLTAIEFLPELRLIPDEEDLLEKLRWQLTVPQLACFFKMLFHRNHFDTTNKSEFCRCIADLFQSSGKDNLSWRNFKNHFDSPSPDTIDFCRQEFLSLSQLAAEFLDDIS